MINLPSLIIDEADNKDTGERVQTCRSRTLTNDTLLSPNKSSESAFKADAGQRGVRASSPGKKKKSRRLSQKRKKFEVMSYSQAIRCSACKVPIDKASTFIQAEKEVDLFFSNCFRNVRTGTCPVPFTPVSFRLPDTVQNRR